LPLVAVPLVADGVIMLAARRLSRRQDEQAAPDEPPEP